MLDKLSCIQILDMCKWNFRKKEKDNVHDLFKVKSTFEMLTVRGQQHWFSTHEWMFLWMCQSFWDTKCFDLRGSNPQPSDSCRMLKPFEPSGSEICWPMFLNTGSGPRVCPHFQYYLWFKQMLTYAELSGSAQWNWKEIAYPHYSDVIIGEMVPQITSLKIVYSNVYSGADQRKHQSSASLAFVWGIHRWPGNSLHKWPVTRRMFHLMTSSCCETRELRPTTADNIVVTGEWT